MKISKKDKEANRQRLVAAAVKLMKKRGFRGTTLREIGKEAGLSEATIYKYFTSKEELLYAYFELGMVAARAKTEAIPGLKDFDFKERLQAFMETMLAGFEEDRDFVKLAHESIFMANWAAAYKGGRRSQEEYFAMLEAWLQQAVLAKEFPEPPLRPLLLGLLWDYLLGVTWYWLQDRSDKHVATTELMDRSLDLILAGMKVDILGRAADLGRFLIREHLLAPLAKGPDWLKDLATKRGRP